MKLLKQFPFIVVVALSIFVLGACSGSTNTTSSSQPTANSTTTAQSVAPINTTQVSSSDIPDSQAFVTFSSSVGRFQLDVPEGWARTLQTSDVSFVFNLDGIQVSVAKATIAPTVNSVRTDQAVTLQQNASAVRDMIIKEVQLPSGQAVLMTYTSNSVADPVTGKQVRNENNCYLFYINGTLATLTLWAPVGADNVDQWARISRSFKWV